MREEEEKKVKLTELMPRICPFSLCLVSIFEHVLAFLSFLISGNPSSLSFPFRSSILPLVLLELYASFTLIFLTFVMVEIQEFSLGTIPMAKVSCSVTV